MKFTAPNGETFRLPDPKAKPTQELLSDVYDDLDSALDLIECVYQATFGPEHQREGAGALRAVLDLAKGNVKGAKDKLHDTIAWAS